MHGTTNIKKMYELISVYN